MERPTEHARGPWDPNALHGGAPAALIAAAFERMERHPQLRIARLGFELLRPIPFAPLTLSTHIVRPGRRVQELAGELSANPADSQQVICRASALRVQEVAADAAAAAASTEEEQAAADTEDAEGAEKADTPTQRDVLPAPEQGRPVRFALDDADGDSFAASAMEMRG